jgi:hypothetical protein
VGLATKAPSHTKLPLILIKEVNTVPPPSVPKINEKKPLSLKKTINSDQIMKIILGEKVTVSYELSHRSSADHLDRPRPKAQTLQRHGTVSPGFLHSGV